ncbi:MAG: hypothetical protein ACREIA_23990 [Opitutaceae bacterium]
MTAIPEHESAGRELALAVVGPTRGASAPALYAKIKPRSKYAYQSGRGGQPALMCVTRLENDFYAFHLDNGNRYRLEDLTFFVRTPDGLLLKLT